ncbi:MAG TPA: hypothetical protein PLT68_08110 [Actinomycetota bacterium]|nr:hypothetical protein [Actinomycetota bacterium]
MTTLPQQPIDSVQVPQTVGLSPEMAFSLVGQSGLAPMFQVQQVAGQPLPGVATQWGQTPESFAGQPPPPGAPATRVTAQSPMAGSWVPRGSVVYMEWAQAAPPPKKSSPVGWIVVGVLVALLVLAGLVWLLTSGGGGDKPKPSESPSPTATETVTRSASPRPTQTVTATATATATTTATATATKTPTPTLTSTTENPAGPAGP